ncbi:hypothetical protein FHS59_002286 [Algoriphagus iocasae]|uniref:AbiJ-NTD3 domain-containing protein n=1 Tax=Algoriphagus iocasae TaxID=1836499 RepID=A0A841MVN2_9BACT|nr:hypothetical protein [Algoriphagus iocasae]MBB6326658.1 hypothetical protein [Algoriphagus iocasae]
MSNKISEVTRRNIFDFIQVEGFWWSGRLDEPDFLSRVFNLDDMPSLDSRFDNAAGDIWQHRINNPYDWPDNWIFNDERFNLLKCDDSTFLNFLCEMVHPLVRPDTSEAIKMVQLFNDNLKTDNFEIIEKTKISDKPIFVGHLKLTGKDSIEKKGVDIKKILDAEYVTQQINLMESSIEAAPHVSIGLSKELIETCCKSIFEGSKEKYNKDWD